MRSRRFIVVGLASLVAIALAVWIIPAQADHGSPSDHIAEIRAALDALEADLEAEPSPDPEPTDEPTDDPEPEPTDEPTEEPSPDPAPTGGMWISHDELMAQPTSGTAWNTVLAASQDSPTASIANNGSNSDVTALAKAIVAVRTQNNDLRAGTINYIDAHIGTHGGAKPTSLGRNMSSLVIAADLLGHRGTNWVNYVKQMQTHEVDGMTLAERHSVRLSNHGTMSGGSRIAIALYLGDAEEVAAAARITAGYLGEHNDHNLTFGDASNRGWMCDEGTMTGINPECSKNIGGGSRAVGGVLPAEYQRCGAPSWPPCQTNYIGGGLAGIAMQVELLRRTGDYNSTAWGNQAMKRAFDRIWFLHNTFGGWWTDANFAGAGHSSHLPSLGKYWYPNTEWPVLNGRSGPNFGWTDFTHGA